MSDGEKTMIKVIKKDGTKEDYNVQKVVAAVTKSADRVLIQFTPEDLQKICAFVDSRVLGLGRDEVHIAEMHNIVEGALDLVNPARGQKLPGLPQLQAGLRAHAGRKCTAKARRSCTSETKKTPTRIRRWSLPSVL